jgi:hypothetical protein
LKLVVCDFMQAYKYLNAYERNRDLGAKAAVVNGRVE